MATTSRSRRLALQAFCPWSRATRTWTRSRRPWSRKKFARLVAMNDRSLLCPWAWRIQLSRTNHSLLSVQIVNTTKQLIFIIVSIDTLWYDGSEFAGRGRDAMSSGAKTGGKHFGRYNERCRVRSKILKELSQCEYGNEEPLDALHMFEAKAEYCQQYGQDEKSHQLNALAAHSIN